MHLKDALLCIDCDEVFTAEGSPCNPRCPKCASSVFSPLSAFLSTWVAFERSLGESNGAASEDVRAKRRKMEIVRSMLIAA
jgi:hypothetical protein